MARILVIDGEEGARIACTRGLEQDGHLVVAVGNAADAREAVRRQMPDLVVLEVGPPSEDGLGVVGELLALRREIRIVLHTAHMLYKDDFRSWLADAYIRKSDDMTELTRTVAEVLARSERPRAAEAIATHVTNAA